MTNGQKMFLSFLAGAAVGTLAGLLLAPESGRNVRKKIASKAKEFQGDLKETLSQLSEKATELAKKEN